MQEPAGVIILAVAERAAFERMAAMATPLGRYATADEVATQIIFLLSDAAASIRRGAGRGRRM